MADLSSLAKDSVKRLGPSAALVSLLPTAVLLLSLVALYASNLYPWLDNDTKANPGVDSIVAAFDKLDLKNGIALSLTLLAGAVLVRPLHVAAVQLLEGYWSDRALQALAKDFATEYHHRRFGRAVVRRKWNFDLAPEDQENPAFAVVARRSRLRTQVERRNRAGRAVMHAYPPTQYEIMPTLLGNALKRAETTAGERYNLDTVASYPRLYPRLSPEVRAQVSMELDLMDTNATFCLVFVVLAVAAAPIAARGHWWFLASATLVAAAWISYRGAIAVARRHANTLAAAYDLHRFDLLASMHVPLPPDPDAEWKTNGKISDFLQTAGERFKSERSRVSVATRYHHARPSVAPEEKGDIGNGGGTGQESDDVDPSEEDD